MSKAAVHTMTKSIAVDYVKQNIHCSCICPARVHTLFNDQFVAQHCPGREQEVLRQRSDASFITGQAYPIDGGVLNQ